MIKLNTDDLPLRSKIISFHFDADFVERFRKCTAFPSPALPPTLACRGFEGLFELFARLEVDFRRLLHISQSFEYLSPLPLETELHSQTQLVKSRERGGSHWLQFESRLFDPQSGQDLIRGQSLILIQPEKTSP